VKRTEEWVLRRKPTARQSTSFNCCWYQDDLIKTGSEIGNHGELCGNKLPVGNTDIQTLVNLKSNPGMVLPKQLVTPAVGFDG
jgi:hypothetical protein